MLSIFNPVFFYQFLAMHHPHSAQADFHHPLEDSLPVAIKYFVRAVKLAPHTWESRAAVRDLLSAEAHKAHFVETVCYYVCSLHDVRRLAELHVIDANVQDIFANHTMPFTLLCWQPFDSVARTRVPQEVLRCCYELGSRLDRVTSSRLVAVPWSFKKTI